MSMTIPAPATQRLNTVRQLVLHILLFILLLVFTSGLASLFTSVFQGFAVDDFGSSPLPLALARVVIAGPLTWLLWRRIKVQLLTRGENASLIWSLQAAAVYTLGALISVHNFSELFGQLIGLRPQAWQGQLGSALAWGLLALWQFRILRTKSLAPRRLLSLGWLLVSYYCLLIAALSLAALLYVALNEILPQGSVTRLAGDGGISAMANISLWAVINFLVWAIHWFGLRLRTAQDRVSQLMLVIAVAASAAANLLGTVFVLSSVLPFPVDHQALSERITHSLPVAAGFALAGALAWIYFAAVMASRSIWLREAARQVVSGISLSIAATGFGMIVNALLTSVATPLAGNTAADLLRSGSALFLVGLISWMLFWRPAIQASAENRRIYLVLIFGISAIVALVALLVVGYRIFAFFLTPEVAGSSLLGEVRAAVGLLLATAAVASYHFAVWRSDRHQLDLRQPAPAASPAAAQPPMTPAGPASLLVVTDPGNAQLAGQLERATGIPVHHLIRSDMTAKAVTDVDGLAKKVAQLPAGTAQGLILLNGEDILLIPLDPASTESSR